MPQNDWNIRKVKADAALARLPRTAAGAVDWGTVRVAHLDTGYTRHEAFGPWTPAGRNQIVLAHLGRDFFQPNRPTAEDPLTQVPLQVPGHGTRTASALSGDGPRIVGLAPRLPLIPYRINDNVLISARACRAIGDALGDAVDRTGCAVASISQGFPVVFDRKMGEGVDHAYENGVIVVAAAGQETNKVCYPSKHRRAISVAGFTRANRLYYPYESYARIDIWAPADPIWRADVGAPPKDYGTGEGTSYAVPHVTAAASMWLRLKGTAIANAYPEPWQRVEAFRVLLEKSQAPLPFKSPGDNTAGMLNIDRLLQAPLPAVASLVKEADRAADDVF